MQLTPTGGQVAKSALGLDDAVWLRQEEEWNDQDSNQNNNNAEAQPTSAILMETQITTSYFSSAPVYPSHFEVPAGYKQVQDPDADEAERAGGQRASRVATI